MEYTQLSKREIKIIKNAIARAWMYYNSDRKAVQDRSRIDYARYRCEGCDKIVPKIQVDHIVPVGPFNREYLDRLFCPIENLQALCRPCHRAKTKIDRAQIKLIKLTKISK